MPLRPAPVGNRRLVRFLALSLVSLLVLLLALNLFSAIGAPRSVGISLAIGWMAIISIGAPLTLFQRLRDQKTANQRYNNWESDARRLSIDRLGLDLASGRVPHGLQVQDIGVLENAATDWRHGREALDTLTWVTGDLAAARDELRRRMDEAMGNLLAEAGAGSPLGISPFALERARSMFLEIGREANQLARTNDCPGKFPTDASIEAMKPGLDKLRAARIARTEDPFIREAVNLRDEY